MLKAIASKIKHILIGRKDSQAGNHSQETASKTYASFAEIPKEKIAYSSSKVAEVVRWKTENNFSIDGPLNPALTQAMSVLKQVSQGKAIKVLEIGGALGNTFDVLNAHLEDEIGQWVVLETPVMVEESAKMNLRDKLAFEQDLDDVDLNKFDLVMIQGTLQYMPDPESLLKKIERSGCKYFYLARTPLLTESAEGIICCEPSNLLDHGPGKASEEFVNEQFNSPVQYLSKEKVEEWMGGKVVREFDESADDVRSFDVGNYKYLWKGYLIHYN